MHLREMRQIKGKPEQLKTSGRAASVFHTDYFLQGFMHGLVRGSTPTSLLAAVAHIILVELFTKSPFKMSIINISNSEFITVGAINNIVILNLYLTPNLRCIETLCIR